MTSQGDMYCIKGPDNDIMNFKICHNGYEIVVCCEKRSEIKNIWTTRVDITVYLGDDDVTDTFFRDEYGKVDFIPGNPENLIYILNLVDSVNRKVVR